MLESPPPKALFISSLLSLYFSLNTYTKNKTKTKPKTILLDFGFPHQRFGKPICRKYIYIYIEREREHRYRDRELSSPLPGGGHHKMFKYCCKTGKEGKEGRIKGRKEKNYLRWWSLKRENFKNLRACTRTHKEGRFRCNFNDPTLSIKHRNQNPKVMWEYWDIRDFLTPTTKLKQATIF